MSSCEGEITGLIVLWCDVAIDCEGEIAGVMVLVAMLCVGVGCDGGLMVMLCDIGVGSGKLVNQ